MPNVWIRQSLLEQMLSDVEFYSPLETGGSFFGYAAANNDVVITHLVALFFKVVVTIDRFKRPVFLTL